MPPWAGGSVFFSSPSLGPIDATTWWTDIGSFRISDCWSHCWLPVVSAWTTGKHGLCCQLVSDSLLNSPPCLPLINTNYNLLLSNYHSITSLTSCYGVITSRGLWVNESVQRLDKAHYYTYYNNSWWAYQYFASGRNLKLRKARQSWCRRKHLGGALSIFRPRVASLARWRCRVSENWQQLSLLRKSRVFNIIFGLTIPLSLRKVLLVFFLQFSLRLRCRTRNTKVVPFICHTNSNQGLLQIWKDHCKLLPCFHYALWCRAAGSQLTAILRDSQYLMRT